MTEEKARFDLVFNSLSIRAMSLDEAISGFLLNLELENRTPSTLDHYGKLLKNFVWFCRQSEQSDFPENIGDFNAGHVRRFLDYLKHTEARWGLPKHSRSNKPVKAATVQRYHACLHSLFAWAVNEEIAAINPVARIKSPTVEEEMIEPLSSAEVKKLIDTCKNSDSEHRRRDTAIVLVLLDTGARASELCGLKLQDWDNGHRIKVKGKGRKERYLPLSPATAKAVWDYVNKERGEAFYSDLFLTRQGEPLRVDSLEAMLVRRAKQAGIRHVHPHLLRHTFAVSWCEAGGPLHGLQSLLGHEKPTMSMRYGKMSSQRAGELHKEFSPVERLNLRFREKGRP